MENVIIIGSGCAGWTAAIYCARANLAPLVVTGIQPGGLLATTTLVENFPGFPEGILGPDLMLAMQKQAERFGAKIQYLSEVTEVHLDPPPFSVRVNGQIWHTRALIIAVGAQPRRLGVPGEKEWEGKGVTYCATCDGALPMFRNQPLVVVGGGDSACEEALYLTRFASQVYLIHRRDRLRASKIMADRALGHPKIQPIWNTVVEAVLGEKNQVCAVELKNTQTGQTSKLDCAGVFVAIGHVPNTRLFEGKLELDPDGYIRVFQGTRTSVPGVFAAGDCVDRIYRQAITAAGMGCMAAMDAERYLSGSGS
ncbi:thioredoxin-disulfide reductase [Candidatus Methylacidithermus pantelleriae]|nr:thioredoxin-disulfide reductase [Candidatus Methylacidithermus pantelleriae]